MIRESKIPGSTSRNAALFVIAATCFCTTSVVPLDITTNRPPCSELLHHAISLPQADFLSNFATVWSGDLVHAALQACTQFVQRPENAEVFRHRWRDFRVRQLLLQRREQVSACVQPCTLPSRLFLSRLTCCSLRFSPKPKLSCAVAKARSR